MALVQRRTHPTCCQGPTVLEPPVNPDKPKGDADSESPQTGHEGCTCRPGALRDASPGSRRLVPVLPEGKELREVSGQPQATQHGRGVGGGSAFTACVADGNATPAPREQHAKTRESPAQGNQLGLPLLPEPGATQTPLASTSCCVPTSSTGLGSGAEHSACRAPGEQAAMR